MTSKYADRYPNICFVKTGWSERYQGDSVYGRHQHLKKFKNGHEALNFMPGPDGQFYLYVPPHRMPANTTDWLVVVMAAGTRDQGRQFGPLEPVGWLRGASFVTETNRPEYANDPHFPLSSDGTKFLYSIIAPEAVLIPPNERSIALPPHGRKLGMASMVVVRENGQIRDNDEWRRDYASYALDLTKKFQINERQEDIEPFAPYDPSALAQDPTNQGYVTAEHRRKVEKAAESFAKKKYGSQYEVTPVMSENRGYDFHMKDRISGEVILLEIKGTSGRIPAFYLTSNERRCLDANAKEYQIIVVTEVLSPEPKSIVISSADLYSDFSLDALAWRVQPMPSPKN